MTIALALSLSLFGLVGPAAWGHEVDHTVIQDTATVVRLVYADGSPFSYESYEIRFADEEIPLQVGRTDHQGRVIFLPERTGTYHIRAFSEDGHGATLSVDADAAGGGEPDATAGGEGAGQRGADAGTGQAAGPNRLSGLMAGVGIILALFGVVGLWRARRRGRP